jgi:hypothetical protein
LRFGFVGLAGWVVADVMGAGLVAAPTVCVAARVARMVINMFLDPL